MILCAEPAKSDRESAWRFAGARWPSTSSCGSERASSVTPAIRTSLAAEDFPALEVVRLQQKPCQVERAFHGYRAPDRTVHPTDDWSKERFRAQALLGMLAYHVECHIRAKLAFLLFAEQNPVPAVEQHSPRVKRGKVSARLMHSFQSLLENLSTITCYRIEPQVGEVPPFEMLTCPSELQQRPSNLWE